MNAQEKELFMYVAEDATYATGNQAIFKASDFMGATAVNGVENKTILRFYPQDASRLGIGGDPTPDTVTITHTNNAHVEVMKAVADAMSNPHGGIMVLADPSNTYGKGTTELNIDPIASTGTAVSISAVVVATV
tara:strand:- start:1215 stop:1616 length:402 start_codon:yes stop_codon:yes gene_type:complete